MKQEKTPTGGGVRNEKKMDLWLPTSHRLKEIMNSFDKDDEKLDKLAMYYLLHHFRPAYDDIGRLKYRYVLAYQVKCLFKIDARYYLAYLESNGVLEDAIVPGYDYYRLADEYRQGKYHTLSINPPSLEVIYKFERIPTKYVTEGELLKRANWGVINK